MTNFVVAFADDMRYDMLPYMPFTRTLGGLGRVFTGLRCSGPLCQPSRTSFLTGQRSRRHRVYDNSTAGLATVDLDNTLAKWLDDAGYRCGLMGKGLNGQAGTEPKDTGWDTWLQITSASLGNGFGIWDGTSSTTSTQHEIDWMLAQATTFIGGSEPWFLTLWPRIPHSDYAPRPVDQHAYGSTIWPIVEEPADVSDQPVWVQNLAVLTDADKWTIHADARGMLRELVGLDYLMQEIMRLIDPSDTVVVFVSDNGYHLGEHRRVSFTNTSKWCPFDVSIRLPMVIAGQGFTAGTTSQPVQIEDITKTIVAMSGADQVIGHTILSPLDGVDLRDVQANPSSYSSRTLLHQKRVVTGALISPDFDAVTTTTRKLVRYYGDTVGNARPDGTISSSNTTVTGAATHHQAINETSPSDAEYVQGNTNTAATFEVSLGNITDPDYADSLRHVMRMRASRSSTANVNITIALVQGTTIKATRTETGVGATITDYSYVLTADEANTITDYTDLRLRFTQNQAANVGMRIYYTTQEIPTRTYAAYDLDTDPNEHANWAGEAGRLTERNTLEAALDALLV